jgi:AraC-like DNA-binding protein
MDPLSDVLSLFEPRGYRVGGFDIGGDWSIRFDAHEGIKCYAVTAGAAWLALDEGEEPVRLQAGDCFLLPRGLPFRLCSDLALPPDDWRAHLEGRRNGMLATVNGGGRALILGGHFILAGPRADMLLGMLPPIVRLQSETDREALRWSFARMRQELVEPRPGNALVVQQLATMILVQALRLHLDASDGVGWLFALSDRQVGAALAAIHREPARRWTVERLAAEAGMSRSSFAARFRARVGDGPIEYLTRWRMLLAGRDLSRGETVGTVSRTMGYESESAFSTAFKRVMGHSPRRHGHPATG